MTILKIIIAELFMLMFHPHEFFRDIWVGFKLGWGKGERGEELTEQDVIDECKKLKDLDF